MSASSGTNGGAMRVRRIAFVRFIDQLTRIFNALGSGAIFALMCLICADITGRYLFNAPIAGVTEIVEIAIVAIVFAQLADTTARNRLTRADALIVSLQRTRPKLARAANLIAALTGIALMAVLAYGIIPSIITDYNRGYYIGTVGIFTFPSWPTKAIIAIGVILTGLQLLFMAVRAIFSSDNQDGELTES